jgi:alkanesulfonate monooxygenase SsuD/methylene tetrahydromethanopterin reductase-like flavin-dependent oxidoreductase (luciferase family)
MDHFFQTRLSGLPPESPMLEAYATLAFIAGRTQHIRLGTLVTAVPNRHPARQAACAPGALRAGRARLR